MQTKANCLPGNLNTFWTYMIDTISYVQSQKIKKLRESGIWNWNESVISNLILTDKHRNKRGCLREAEKKKVIFIAWAFLLCPNFFKNHICDILSLFIKPFFINEFWICSEVLYHIKTSVVSICDKVTRLLILLFFIPTFIIKKL